MAKEKLSKSGSELFIVDNSDQDWKVLSYLREWCQLSKAIDIATGYFEIGSLLALDGEWQKVDQIRILMGDEVSKRTRQTFEEGLVEIKEKLDSSIEVEKEKNDFLLGVPAIVDAIRSKKIVCRVYRREKFHAKTYITHSRQEVIGSFALVGSSNFTYPGLSDNVELNVQISGRQVTALQDWYDQYWEEAEDVTPEILRTIESHLREYTPFEIYAKALYEYHRYHELTPSQWEKDKSKMFNVLSPYQKEGYHALMNIAERYKGAFLCDGVGLGKTFIGLMLLERMLLHERKRVVLLLPKAARKSVWESKITKYMPDILNNRFVSLAIYNHTDLLRKSSSDRNWPAEFKQIKENADVFIIDEAHNFRNRASSRYRELFDIIGDNKQVFLLTATPINNSLLDLQHQIELFTNRDEKHFNQAPLGIHSLTGHFRKMENDIEEAISEAGTKGILLDNTSAQEVLLKDDLFRGIVVQRSRSYVMKSSKQCEKVKILFPKRENPQVAAYSLKKVYGPLLDKIERAFNREKPLLRLAVYCQYDAPYYKGDPEKVDPFVLGRHIQIVALIRVLLLNRFESSVVAFKFSCENLLLKLVSFIELHRPEKGKRWVAQHESLIKNIIETRKVTEDEEAEEDVIPEELKEEWIKLSEEEFNVTEIVADTLLDLDQLVEFLNNIKDLTPKHDNKLQSLIKLLENDEDLKSQKVLIFTEFMSTAKYLKEQLSDVGIGSLAEIDSTFKGERETLIRRFSPYYNDSSSDQLKKDKLDEIRVLISTDILSEGLNIQDASLVINYDIHWNPVRLMQRIGRVDRRLDEDIEKQIVKNHPETEKIRGRVRLWNFLPPDELNKILTLYARVTHKTLRISKTFGIEGKKLLTPEDDYEALKNFTQIYEGETTPAEEMYLKYQGILEKNIGLEEKLKTMRLKAFSGKESTQKGKHMVFFCYRLPTQNLQTGEWDSKEGFTRWYLYDLESKNIIEDALSIDPIITCVSNVPRVLNEERKKIIEARKEMEKYIHKTYMRQAQIPLKDNKEEQIKPMLITWMELS